MNTARVVGLLLGAIAAIVLFVLLSPDAAEIAPTGRALGRVAAFGPHNPIAGESPRTVASYLNASEELTFSSVTALGERLGQAIGSEPSIQGAVRSFDIVSVRRHGIELGKVEVIEIDPRLAGDPTLDGDVEIGLQDCVAQAGQDPDDDQSSCLRIAGREEVAGVPVLHLNSGNLGVRHWRQDNVLVTAYAGNEQALAAITRELIENNLAVLLEPSGSAHPDPSGSGTASGERTSSAPSTASETPASDTPEPSQPPSQTPRESASRSAPDVSVAPTPSPQSPSQGPVETETAVGDVSIAILDTGFAASSLTVREGARLTWTNRSTQVQTVTSSSGPFSFESGSLVPGATYSVTFDTPGSYTYASDTEPAMVGSIVVLGPVSVSPSGVVEPSLPNVAMTVGGARGEVSSPVLVSGALLIGSATLLLLCHRQVRAATSVDD